MSEDLVLKELSANVSVPAHVYMPKRLQSDELILLLHGFGHTAKDFVALMAEAMKGYPICALQAPFPVSVKGKSGSGRQIGYTWYAYDIDTNTFQIPIAVGVDFAKQALDQLQLTSKISRVVGFSQGGYFAPFMAQVLPNVKQVIGINSRFKHEDLSKHEISFRLDAINGENDEIVDPKNARHSHDQLIQQGCVGKFTLLPNTSHDFSDVVGLALRDALGLL